MVVRSAEQHGAGYRACRAYVEVGVAHTPLRQFVQYRCIDLASVTSQVRVTHVIGDDEEKIGAFALLSSHTGSCKSDGDSRNQQSCRYDD